MSAHRQILGVIAGVHVRQPALIEAWRARDELIETLELRLRQQDEHLLAFRHDDAIAARQLARLRAEVARLEDDLHGEALAHAALRQRRWTRLGQWLRFLPRLAERGRMEGRC